MMHFDGRPIEYYLRSYRRQAHLSQKELAYLLGATTPAKVSRYESGLRIPSLESGLAYEAALGEPVAKLFRGRYEAIHAEVEARRRKLEAQKEEGASVASLTHHVHLDADPSEKRRARRHRPHAHGLRLRGS